MENNSKGFANIAILIIVLLAAAGVGYVIVMRMQQAPLVEPSSVAVTPPESTPVAPTPSAAPSSSVDTSNWKIYRDKEYGFEMKYPSYLTLRSNDAADPVGLVKGTRRKHFKFGFSPDSGGALWGSLSIFSADRFAMYKGAEWVFYDQATARWYQSTEQAIDRDSLTYEKNKKITMIPSDETDQGVPVYGGGYGDAGYSSTHNVILVADKSIVIDVFYGSGGEPEVIPPPVMALLRQFNQDVTFIVKSIRLF